MRCMYRMYYDILSYTRALSCEISSHGNIQELIIPIIAKNVNLSYDMSAIFLRIQHEIRFV